MRNSGARRMFLIIVIFQEIRIAMQLFDYTVPDYLVPVYQTFSLFTTDIEVRFSRGVGSPLKKDKTVCAGKLHRRWQQL